MTDKILDDATPAKYFARPPYRAELFFERSGWSGVMNRDGLNVLTFKSMPGKPSRHLTTQNELPTTGIPRRPHDRRQAKDRRKIHQGSAHKQPFRRDPPAR